MQDLIMSIGAVFFFIVFGMMFFMFLIYIAAFFKPFRAFPSYHKKVTVIIPAYNEGRSIKECITALKACAYPQSLVDIIVVDDGSTDATVRIAKRFAGVRVLTQKHKGKVAALNLGLAHADSEIIVTIDADTLVDPLFLEHITRPFSDKSIGATSGAVMVENDKSVLGVFQHTEYLMNNLARRNFSAVFNTGIWFFGSLAAYRAKALREVGGFKEDTMAEDWDIVLEIKRKGYAIINVPKAVGRTIVPDTFKGLLKQRVRWSVGGFQALYKNRELIKLGNPSLLYLFVNHFWWAIYALFSLPLIIYQVSYWMPPAAAEIPLYLFRWFTLVGPFYVLYKIGEWGINPYNFFAVLCGVISFIFAVSAFVLYRNKVSVRDALVMFLYFPYTILLNLYVAYSVTQLFRLRKKHFVR